MSSRFLIAAGIAVLLLSRIPGASAAAGDEVEAQPEISIPSRYSSYKQVTTKQLKVMPEEYNNDRMYVEGKFTDFTTTFPNYFENNGFKNSKYFAFMLAGSSTPVLVRKSDDTNQMMAALKRGAKLRVFGRVKDFSYKPRYGPYPHYYIECKYIQVLSNEPEKRGPGQAVRGKLRDRKPGPGPFKRRRPKP